VKVGRCQFSTIILGKNSKRGKGCSRHKKGVGKKERAVGSIPWYAGAKGCLKGPLRDA